MTPVAISLGSNLGDRLAHLRSALVRIQKLGKIQAVSRPYETEPMYYFDQPAFLNAGAIVNVAHGPLELLQELKRIEKDVGRMPRERNGPREIDLDLVSYGVAKYTYSFEGETLLTLPHPRAFERRFVLEPLFEIDPNLLLPGFGTVSELLLSTEVRTSHVQKLSDALLPVHSAR